MKQSCIAMNWLLGATVAASIHGSAIAESLSTAPVVFKAGNWRVVRTVDQMTDKTSCTGIYKSQFGIQLTDDNLYITVRAPRGYRLRLDDQPQAPLSLASDLERKIDSIIVSGSDFQKLLGSKRLRYSAITVLERVEEGDLDLDGIAAAHQKIASGCAADPVVEDSPAKQSTGCSAEVRAKLEKKLSAKDIEEVCG